MAGSRRAPLFRRAASPGVRAPRLAHRRPRRAARTRWPRSRRAAAEGFGYLELDVHASADGVAVVHHDVALDRTTDGTGRPVRAHRRRAGEGAGARTGADPAAGRGAGGAARDPDHDRAEVRRRRRADARRGGRGRQAWDRVCIGGFEQAWVNAARRGGGERLCTSMAKRDILALRTRAWLRGALPWPLRGDVAHVPVSAGPDPGRGREPAAARRTRTAARCTSGRSTLPSEMRRAARPRRRRAPVGPAGPAARGAAGARPVARREQPGPGLRLGAVGLGVVGLQRGDPHVRLLRLPHRTRSAAACRARSTPGRGWATRIGGAGLLIALAAPVLGQRSDAAGRRKFATGVWTACTVATMAGLFAVREDCRWLVARPGAPRPGVDLLRAGVGVVQRDAGAGVDTRRRWAASPASAGRWATSGASSSCSGCTCC